MEVRDPETEETRGRRKAKEEETETFPGAQLQLTDGKERAVVIGREEEREEGISAMCEWRLSLEGAIRGHRGGTAGTPPPSSPPSPVAPEIWPGK